MDNREYFDVIDAAVSATLQTRRVERDIEKRLALIEQIGDDVCANGTTIGFKKKFTNRGHMYTYAAVKRQSDGLWCITSTKFVDPISWDELVLFMISGAYPTTQYDIMVPYVEVETAQGDVETPTAE